MGKAVKGFVLLFTFLATIDYASGAHGCSFHGYIWECVLGTKWSGHGLVITMVGQEERVSCLSIFGSWIWVVCCLSCLLGYHMELRGVQAV